MTESCISLLSAFAIGSLLALGYLRHLRWSVTALPHAPRPGRRLLGGLVIRMLAACGTFYAVGRFSGAFGIAAAMLGFLVARTVVMRHSQATPARVGDSR